MNRLALCLLLALAVLVMAQDGFPRLLGTSPAQGTYDIATTEEFHT